MTTVIDTGRAGPQTHAFVVGVDHYPFCGPQGAQDGQFASLARGIPDLSCATASARAVATWLCENLLQDGYRPLGSLELLLSTRAPAHVDVGHGPIPVDTATFDHTEQAFDAWYQRCDQHADNVALLFFFGHGLRLRSADVLLLGDVGRRRNAFFDHAWDFRRTKLAMSQCRSETQCFFIDACRVEAAEDLEVDTDGARSLRQPPKRPQLRHAPVVYSTTPGDPARGLAGHPTAFTEAVLASLAGRAAVQMGQHWEVRTDNLVATVNRVLNWADPEARRQLACGGESPGDGVVRRLASDPVVPFQITCDPREAIGRADLELVRGTGRLVGGPEYEAWRSSAPVGEHQLRASFPAGDYHDGTGLVHIHPPHRSFELAVDQA